MRKLISILLVAVSLSIAQAQTVDIEVIAVDIGDEQQARLVPLYQNFDFFWQLATGELTAGDLSREERFMITCSVAWFGAVDAFELPSVADGDVEASIREAFASKSAAIDDEVLSVIENALIASAELLPSDDLIVCIAPVNTDDSFIGGTARDGTMTLMLDGFDAQNTYTVDRLSVVVAHEYHHHARDADRYTRTSGLILLERVVTEGMAELFASSVYPDAYDIDFAPDYQDQERAIWNTFEPVLRDLDILINDYMFGKVDGLPPAAGYYLGYRILQEFVANNPDVSVEEWTRMSGDEIFEASGYSPLSSD